MEGREVKVEAAAVAAAVAAAAGAVGQSRHKAGVTATDIMLKATAGGGTEEQHGR